MNKGRLNHKLQETKEEIEARIKFHKRIQEIGELCDYSELHIQCYFVNYYDKYICGDRDCKGLSDCKKINSSVKSNKKIY